MVVSSDSASHLNMVPRLGCCFRRKYLKWVFLNFKMMMENNADGDAMGINDEGEMRFLGNLEIDIDEAIEVEM